MIQTKADLKYYIDCDIFARFGHIPTLTEKILGRELIAFNKVLRRQEYNLNCRNGLIKKIVSVYYRYKKRKLGKKLGWFIPPNTFGPGLCIVHIGPVIVSEYARFGRDCRVHAMVNIGASNGIEDNAPHGGDNIYFAPGVKMFGKIRLASNIAIGANSVVNKDFIQDCVTIAGVPAKVVSNKGTAGIINSSAVCVNKL